MPASIGGRTPATDLQLWVAIAGKCRSNELSLVGGAMLSIEQLAPSGSEIHWSPLDAPLLGVGWYTPWYKSFCWYRECQ